MFKILIVDDEYYFRQALITTFPWHELDIEVCGEAEDGEEALSMFSSLSPDIALVDINMPIMDGLELAREIKNRGYNTKLIILSGYSEFNYAKQALELGVNNYLLKPVNEIELSKTLSEVKSLIESETKIKFEIGSLKKQVKDNIPFLRDKLLNDLILGNSLIYSKELLNKASFLELDLSSDFFKCILIEIDDFKNMGWDESDKELWKYAVFNISQEVLSERYNCNFCFDNSNRVCCLLGFNKEPDVSQDSELLVFCDLLRSSVQKYLKFSVTVGIGNIHKGINKISASYNESVFSLNNKLVVGNNKVIPYNSMQDSELIYNYLPVELKRNLLMAMRLNNFTEVSTIIKNILDDFRNLKVQTEIVYVNCVELISICIEFSVECALDMKAIFSSDFNLFRHIYELESLADIEGWLIITFESTIDLAHKNKKNKSQKLIDEIRKYIETNYYKSQFRIDDIASHFFLNYHYLCKLFRKETGITLNDYISEIRIKVAKELIDLGNCSITDISIKAGYDNSNYFSKCFKSHYGLSPSKYIENKKSVPLTKDSE